MVLYSERSLRAYAALYRPYNDIDIFVEDRSLVGVYERLFNRLLAGVASVAAVIPLNGKTAVLEEARRLRQDRSRRRFFLVDGDFDWAIGRVPRVRKLYTLKSYSIENVAWEIDAIRASALHFATELSDAQVVALLSNEIIAEMGSLLLSLFVTYAVAYKLDATCETVSFSVVRLLLQDRRRLSERKIHDRIRSVYRSLRREHGLTAVTAARSSVVTTLRQRAISDVRLVSGKSYLLPLMMFLFQDEFGFRGNPRQLLSLLLENSTLRVDPGLRTAVRRAARSEIILP